MPRLYPWIGEGGAFIFTLWIRVENEFKGSRNIRSLIGDPIPIPALWDNCPSTMGRVSHKAGIGQFLKTNESEDMVSIQVSCQAVLFQICLVKSRDVG